MFKKKREGTRSAEGIWIPSEEIFAATEAQRRKIISELIEHEYDHAKEGDLAAEGDVSGLYSHMKGHPAESIYGMAYDDVFHIAERVAEAILNERLEQELWGYYEYIEDEVSHQIEQRVQGFMDDMEAEARLAVKIGLEDNDCVHKGEN